MKKTTKLFMLLSLLCVFTGCENTKRPLSNSSDQQVVDYSSEYYEIIGLEKFKEVYASSEPTIIYFGSEGCSACLSFKPVAKQFAKENSTNVYFLLTDNLTQDEYDELNTLVSFTYIPFVTIYKNKEQLYGESGAMQLSELKDLAITYGVISE